MELAVKEVKTQAKMLLKAIKDNKSLNKKLLISIKRLALPAQDEMKLKHCLTLVSQQLGFDNWHHAQTILSGCKETLNTLGMGSFLYPDSAGVFINEWFVDHQKARSQLIKNTGEKWLLPYKKQFIVVEKEFIDTLNIDENYQHLWAEINNDMVESYNSVVWDTLVCQVIKNRSKGY